MDVKDGTFVPSALCRPVGMRASIPPGQATTDYTVRNAPRGSAISVKLAKLPVRARIRDAALKHFADEGYEQASIRAIARTAGISHSALRHHYGSKSELRAECDDHICKTLRRLNTRLVADAEGAAGSWQAPKRFRRYVARSLADGSPTAGPIFDELVTMTTLWLERATVVRPDQRAVGTRTQAVLIATIATSVPLLGEHLSRALGIDVGAPEGGEILGLALLDNYSEKLIERETADHFDSTGDLNDAAAPIER